MRTIIQGRLTKEVVVETLASGKMVANIRIADNKAYRDRNGYTRRRTSFYNVKVWGTVAEALGRTVGKGDLVKFDTNVKPNSYLSEKRMEVVNELVFTANRFKLVRQARANLAPRNH